MFRKLMGAVTLLGAFALAASGVHAQPVPPLVWDGVVVPTAGNCNTTDSPVAWRATYRPYIANTVNTQPSQLVIFTDFQQNNFGLKINSATAQFNGSGSAGRFFVGSDINDSTSGNTGGPGTANFNFTQTPAAVKLITTYVKITGTIVNPDMSPGLGCASSIIGVFTPRKQ